AEGYVTPAGAEREYGVVWRDGAVDAAASRTRRAELRATRPHVRLEGVADLDADRGRLVRLDAATSARLGVGVGAVMELVNPRGAPLRAWVAGVIPGDGHRVEIAAGALALLAMPDGATVELRAVHSGVLGQSDARPR
ncbi:MAG TPA: hypothetical protein VN323_15310, partial [Candidatus Dormibacteraeota bacterium]|nr:hypothetical protein [Candidatus Dormibacteraeota bacterium]